MKKTTIPVGNYKVISYYPPNMGGIHIHKGNYQIKNIMSSVNKFKIVLKEYLDKLAKEDELFAKTYSKKNKNIDDCANYIITAIQKSSINCITDDEVYGMAVHYYDEDDIKLNKEIPSCRVVTPKSPALTAIEVEEAKKIAIEEEIRHQKDLLKKKKVKKVQKDLLKSKSEGPTLF